MNTDTVYILLVDILEAVGLSNKRILSYRPEGKKIKEYLLTEICKPENFKFINFDFQGIEICDVSVVDEVILEIMLYVRNLKTRPVLYLSNLHDYVYDSVRAAQLLKEEKMLRETKEKFKIPLLIFDSIKGLEILGELETVLKETFEFVKRKRIVTARDIAVINDIAINSASNRLKKLYDNGLIFRRTATDETGKFFEYVLPENTCSP